MGNEPIPFDGLLWVRVRPGHLLNHAEALAGVPDGFRLPTAQELGAGVDRGRYGPAVTDALRPLVPDGASFWTAETSAQWPTSAWMVSFWDGAVFAQEKAGRGFALACRKP